MPDETVVAGPVRDVVDVPGVHRRAVAVHAAHADVRRLFEIEMAARRTVVQTVALPWRSEEHTSELQSLMRISYAVFCLKKKHISLFVYHGHQHSKIHPMRQY